MNYKIIQLPEMIGNSLKEVREYLIANYPDKVAVESDRQPFIDGNPELPECTWCYFLGSEIAHPDGEPRIPAVSRNFNSYNLDKDRLSFTWRKHYYAVIHE